MCTVCVHTLGRTLTSVCSAAHTHAHNHAKWIECLLMERASECARPRKSVHHGSYGGDGTSVPGLRHPCTFTQAQVCGTSATLPSRPALCLARLLAGADTCAPPFYLFTNCAAAASLTLTALSNGLIPVPFRQFSQPPCARLPAIFPAGYQSPSSVLALPSQQIDTFQLVSIAFSAFKQVTLFSSHTFFPIMHLSLSISVIPFHLANCFPLPSTSSSPLTPCLPSLPLPPVLPRPSLRARTNV